MCYYNGQKVTQNEFIRLKNLEKVIAKYPFLNRDLNIGFNYGKSAILKRRGDEQDFDIVEMEWGFLPGYIRDREQAEKFHTGYKKENGQWQQPILTLNAMSEEMLLPKKMYRDAALIYCTRQNHSLLFLFFYKNILSLFRNTAVNQKNAQYLTSQGSHPEKYKKPFFL